MCTAFLCSDYYGFSAPPRRHQPTTGLPTHRPGWAAGRGQRDGCHVHSRTLRRGRRPTMPLQPRYGYAAGIHHGLPTSNIDQSKSSPPDTIEWVRAATQPRSIRFELVLHLRAFNRWFLTYAFPSCLSDPHHLTVLACPVVVRAACHPPRRLPDQAALSFSEPAATGPRQCPFATAGFKNASWRSTSMKNRT